MMKRLSLATAALLSVSAYAQTSQAKPSAYVNSTQSQYSGVARPSDEQIVGDPQQAAQPVQTPAMAAPVQSAPVPQPVYSAPVNASPMRTQDPDYGIVTTPVSDAGSYSTASRPALKSHVYDPDADIVTAVTLSPNQLPQGTPFHARLLGELSASTITPGTPFEAQLTRDVMHLGHVVIPIGSYVHGRVTYVSAGRRIGGLSTMRLTPEEVVLPDGTHYQFRGIVTQTAGSNTKTDSEGYVIDKGHPVRTAAEYGMTAGSGAVLGAVVAGPVGAGVGTLIGAGVMTVHWLREKNAAVLPAGSMVTFALSSPLSLSTPVPITNGPDTSSYTVPATPPPAVSTYVEPKVVN
jgi:hypothetical protein